MRWGPRINTFELRDGPRRATALGTPRAWHIVLSSRSAACASGNDGALSRAAVPLSRLGNASSGLQSCLHLLIVQPAQLSSRLRRNYCVGVGSGYYRVEDLPERP